MVTDDTRLRLFALCPMWLWPVLAISLVALGERLRRLRARGAAGWEIRLTGWGRAVIARVYWPGEPPHWKDALYRGAMGEPVAPPPWQPPALGLWSDDASADWARGTGWYGLRGSAAGRGHIPLAMDAAGVPVPGAGALGGVISRQAARLLRPP